VNIDLRFHRDSLNFRPIFLRLHRVSRVTCAKEIGSQFLILGAIIMLFLFSAAYLSKRFDQKLLCAFVSEVSLKPSTSSLSLFYRSIPFPTLRAQLFSSVFPRPGILKLAFLWHFSEFSLIKKSFKVF